MDLTTPDFARTTPRLTLRPMRPTDRAAWVRAHVVSGAHFDRWMPRCDPTVPHERRFELQLNRAADGARMGTQFCFVAEHRLERELVAFCTLSQIARGPFQNAYAGWRVSLPYVRQGLGSEAVSALLDVAFAIHPAGLGLHRVQANVIPTNAPSLRLARNVGFREEGYAKAYLEIDGRYQDHVMFAKLSEEHLSSSPPSS